MPDDERPRDWDELKDRPVEIRRPVVVALAVAITVAIVVGVAVGVTLALI